MTRTLAPDVTLQFDAPAAPTTAGSARLLPLVEAIQKGLTRNMDNGQSNTARPYIGLMRDNDGISTSLTPLYAPEKSHILTGAPTRAGKGVNQIVPNLLSWLYSAFVLDPKGENYRCTAGFRSSMGHKVVRFSPFEAHSDRINPVMSIPVGDDPADTEEQAYFVARLACPHADSGSADSAFFAHWDIKVVSALLIHVRTAPLDGTPDPTDGSTLSPAARAAVRQRSMAEVSRLLSLDNASLRALLARLKLSAFAVVRQTAMALDRLVGAGDSRTADNVLASTARHMDVWSLTRVARATYVPGAGAEPGADEIDFAELRDGKTSIYLVIPPDEITNWKGVLRVMVGLMVRKLRMTQKQGLGKPPVLALLDEFPQLEYMQPIEQSMLYMAGYGLIYWFFVQSLNDIERIYPKSYRTFLANTATQCFFGVSDDETAEYVSKLAGSATVANFGQTGSVGGSTGRSWSSSSGSSNGHGGSTSNEGQSYSSSEADNWGRSETISFVGRRLIMPDEVRTLGPQSELIFIRHTKPILAHMVPYYAIPKYEQASRMEPPHPIGWDC